MYHESVDLLLVSVLAVTAMVLATLGWTDSSLRVLFALPLVLVLPGYALAEALWPKRMFLTRSERVLFALGLSLLAAIIGGLTLHAGGWGLYPNTWALFLGGLTLVGSMVALLRRDAQPLVVARIRGVLRRWLQRVPFQPTSVYTRGGRGSADKAMDYEGASRFDSIPSLNGWQALLFTLAAMVACSAWGMASQVAGEFPERAVVQLWMLPVEGQARNGLRVGINHLGAREAKYRLWVHLDGYMLREWREVRLGSEESWEAEFTLPPQWRGQGRVEAVLYRSEAPQVPYRQVVWWGLEGELKGK